MSSLLLLFTWETRESSSERKVSVDALGRKAIELCLIGFHLGDEVNEMLGLGELVEILGINNVTKLVLNLNDQLNHIKGIETVVLKLRVEGYLCLLCGAEIVLYDAEDILSDLIVVL